MKASFDPMYQEETGICEHKDSGSSQLRGNEKMDSGYRGKIKVGIKEGCSIPAGKLHGGKQY
jgi:hypothetical protein